MGIYEPVIANPVPSPLVEGADLTVCRYTTHHYCSVTCYRHDIMLRHTVSPVAHVTCCAKQSITRSPYAINIAHQPE